MKLLAADLRSLPAGICEEPLDAVTLAEYLDHALDTSEQSRVEEHLATCRACRELATEAGLAIADVERKGLLGAVEDLPLTDRRAAPFIGNERAIESWQDGLRNRSSGQASRRPTTRRLLAIAATVLILFGAGIWLRSWQQADLGERLTAVGVDETTFRETSSRLRAQARKALDGELEDPALFKEFLNAEHQSALRTASVLRSPEPISPRWSVIREERPSFRWSLPGSDPRSAEPVHGEIMLVDDREQFVAALAFELTPHASGSPELPWPAEQPSLEPGRTYAWKVNAEIDGEWLSSEYVPFRLLIEEDRLANLPQNKFLASVELASLGLYEEAVEMLAQAQMTQEGEAIRRRLLHSLFLRKHCSQDLVEEELERWLVNAP